MKDQRAPQMREWACVEPAQNQPKRTVKCRHDWVKISVFARHLSSAARRASRSRRRCSTSLLRPVLISSATVRGVIPEVVRTGPLPETVSDSRGGCRAGSSDSRGDSVGEVGGVLLRLFAGDTFRLEAGDTFRLEDSRSFRCWTCFATALWCSTASIILSPVIESRAIDGRTGFSSPSSRSTPCFRASNLLRWASTCQTIDPKPGANQPKSGVSWLTAQAWLIRLLTPCPTIRQSSENAVRPQRCLC